MNVVPTSVPPQVPLTLAVKFALGVTVNVVVAPGATFRTVDGFITPPAPAEGVTWNERGLNVAATVHGATTGFVVYVAPTKLPPQVPPTAAPKFALGITTNTADEP